MLSSLKLSQIAKYMIALMVLGCVLAFPLFLSGFYVSHDGELQLGRIPAYARELFSGQIPVRWSDDLNYSFGTPIFSFMYPLPYLLASVVYQISGSAIFSLKTVLLLTFLGSGLAFFHYMYLWKKNALVAFVAAAVYLLLPYRMLNIFTRVALGETVAFMMPPLLMLGGLYLSRQDYKKGILLTSLSVAGLILAHNAMALIFVVPLFLWFFITSFADLQKSKVLLKTTVFYVASWICGLLLSAFFWMPALLEKKYTMVGLFLKAKDYHEYFLSLSEVLHRTWFVSGTTAPAFWGITGFVIFGLSLYSIWGKWKSKQNCLEIIAVLGFLFSALYMTTQCSSFIWDHVPFLPFFQLPWRFLSLAVWATALLVPFAFANIKYKKSLAVVIILLLLWEAFPVTQTLKKLEISDKYFDTYPQSTTWHEEGTPVWTAGSPTAYPPSDFIVAPMTKVKSVEKLSTMREFVVSSREESTFVLEHFYFPGWKAFVNGQEVPIEFQDIEYRGLMKISVPAGENTVMFRFTRTKVRLLSELLTLSGFILLGGLYILSSIKRIKN